MKIGHHLTGPGGDQHVVRPGDLCSRRFQNLLFAGQGPGMMIFLLEASMTWVCPGPGVSVTWKELWVGRCRQRLS